MQSKAMQSRAMQSKAKQCKGMQSKAMQSHAMQSNAEQSNAKQCKATQCKAEPCKAKQCKAMQSKAKQWKAKQCKAMQRNAKGKAKQCKAKQCKAEESKAMQSKERGIVPPRAFEIQRHVERVAKPSFANLAKMSVASWACEVVLQNRSSFFWQCCKTCFVVTVLQHRLCCKTSCVAKPHVWLISCPQHYMLIGSLLSSKIF